MTTLDELIADSWFPFAGEITVKPLDGRVIPEPPRPMRLDLLPDIDDTLAQESLRRVGAAMAADGGVAHL